MLEGFVIEQRAIGMIVVSMVKGDGLGAEEFNDKIISLIGFLKVKVLFNNYVYFCCWKLKMRKNMLRCPAENHCTGSLKVIAGQFQ